MRFMSANQPAAANPAIASRLKFGRHGRGVAIRDVRRHARFGCESVTWSWRRDFFDHGLRGLRGFF